MPAQGDTFPDFELQDQDGNLVKLSDYRGQKIILFAYPKADTPGCTKQACAFRDNLPRFGDVNAVIFGISGDAPEDNKKFKDKFDLPYSLLSDPDHNVLTELGAYGEKKNYGKVYMGVIRSHWVIDEDGTVIDERRNVQALKSAPLALRALGIEVVEE